MEEYVIASRIIFVNYGFKKYSLEMNEETLLNTALSNLEMISSNE
jgi:hypothetical protein